MRQHFSPYVISTECVHRVNFAGDISVTELLVPLQSRLVCASDGTRHQGQGGSRATTVAILSAASLKGAGVHFKWVEPKGAQTTRRLLAASSARAGRFPLLIAVLLVHTRSATAVLGGLGQSKIY